MQNCRNLIVHFWTGCSAAQRLNFVIFKMQVLAISASESVKSIKWDSVCGSPLWTLKNTSGLDGYLFTNAFVYIHLVRIRWSLWTRQELNWQRQEVMSQCVGKTIRCFKKKKKGTDLSWKINQNHTGLLNLNILCIKFPFKINIIGV